jgi:mannosyltransferase OCH1-like enzyme
MIKTYKDLKGRIWEGEGIPKWVYRSGSMSLEDLPEIIKQIYKESIIDKNPDYELFYFDDADCEQFIKDEWGEDYLEAYNILIPTAYKSDLFRYLLLYNYGGIWGDFTQVSWVPFDEIIQGMDRVFCLDHPATFTDTELYNAIMMVKPKDKVVNNAIAISRGNILTRDYCTGPLDITGPVVLGEAFRASEYHNAPYNTKILPGIHNKTRILFNPNYNPLILDENQKPVIVKKLGFHVEILYKPDNKHYQRAWPERTVFNY